MVHRRIARQQHLAQRVAAQHPPERLANDASEFARMVKVVLQAAHHVGPVARLRIERGLDAKHLAAGEIHHLYHQRGRTQVDHRTSARSAARWAPSPRQ